MVPEPKSSAIAAACAPVVLFVYNRPEHTRRTLESLMANPPAKETDLYIYADGPKPGEHPEKVEAVRRIVRERPWCGRVELIEAATNRGLATSILAGVSACLETAERVIVLEDDLELAPGFLEFMNRGLKLYRDEPRVKSISGFLPELPGAFPETLFLRTTSSWGWATWRRAWRELRMDAAALAEEIVRTGKLAEFNLDGGYNYFEQLRQNAEGRLRTWAVLWYASIFLAEGLTLHPGRSLVRNIGHDETGTHSRKDARFEMTALAKSVHVEPIEIVSDAGARAAMRRRYQGSLIERAGRGFRDAVRRWRRRVAIIQ
jgi:hypothetical protein